MAEAEELPVVTFSVDGTATATLEWGGNKMTCPLSGLYSDPPYLLHALNKDDEEPFGTFGSLAVCHMGVLTIKQHNHAVEDFRGAWKGFSGLEALLFWGNDQYFVLFGRRCHFQGLFWVVGQG